MAHTRLELAGQELDHQETAIITSDCAEFTPDGRTLLITGKGGRERQEDILGYHEDENLLRLVVTDGMGGCEAGDIAARVVTEKLMNHKQAGQLASIPAGAYAAQTQLLTSFPNRTTENAPGAVFGVVDIRGDIAEITHLGDSRVYVCRYSGTSNRYEIIHLTPDNDGIVDDNFTAMEIGMNSPRIKDNEVKHSIGALKQNIPPLDRAPERVQLEQGDIILMMTDGVHKGNLRIKEILAMLQNQLNQNTTEEAKAQAIKEALLRMKHQRRNSDNFTLIVHCHGESIGEALKKQSREVAHRSHNKTFGATLIDSLKEMPGTIASLPLRTNIILGGISLAQIISCTILFHEEITELIPELRGSTATLPQKPANTTEKNKVDYAKAKTIYREVCKESVAGEWTNKKDKKATFPPASLDKEAIVDISVTTGKVKNKVIMNHFPADCLHAQNGKEQGPQAVAAKYPVKDDDVTMTVNSATYTANFEPPKTAENRKLQHQIAGAERNNTLEIKDESGQIWMTCSKPVNEGCKADAIRVANALKAYSKAQ